MESFLRASKVNSGAGCVCVPCRQDMAVELLHRDEERTIVRLGKGATSAIFDLSRVCSFELGRGGGSGFFSAEVVIRLHVTNERTKILRFHFATLEEAKAAVRAVDKLLPASAMRQHWAGDGTLYSKSTLSPDVTLSPFYPQRERGASGFSADFFGWDVTGERKLRTRARKIPGLFWTWK